MGIERRRRSLLITAVVAAVFLRLPIGANDYVYVAADTSTPIVAIGPSSAPGINTITFVGGYQQDVTVAPETVLKAIGATIMAVAP